MATTWNPSDKGSDVNLTNGDLTAASGGGCVRTVANGGASGKVCFEIVLAATDNSQGQAIGFANSTLSMTGDSSASPNAITAWTDGNVYMNNGSTPVGAFAAGSWPSGTTITVAIDTINKRFWARKDSGNWNNSGTADPATNTGGYAITNAGPYYGVFQGFTNLGFTLQAVTTGIPSGFTDLMGAGGYTLAADAGSFSLSGQTAGLKRGLKVAGAVGSFALSGQGAGLVRGRPMTVDAGAFSLSGQAAALRTARVLAGSSGSFALTGQDATLTYAPAGGSVVLNAEAGAFSLTGQAAGVARGLKLPSAAGAFEEVGQSAGLKAARNLAAAAGGFVLSGQAAALKAGWKVAAGAGAFVVSGQAAAFIRGRTLTAAEGAFTLSGQAAGLKAGRRLTASSGSFVVTGASVDFPYGAIIAPSLSSRTVSAGALSSGGFTAPPLASRTVTA